LESAAAFVGASVAFLAHLIFERTQSVRLALTLGYGAPFEETEPASGSGPAIRYFSVAIKNLSASGVENCLVKLTRMKALDGKEFKNVYLPIGLLTQQQQIQCRPGGPFNLRAGETKYVRIASLDERDANSEIALAYETSGIPNLVPRGDYLLKLVAFGGSDPTELTLRLNVDAEGRLKLRQYADSSNGPNNSFESDALKTTRASS
jgi:hypothetical protein